MNNMRTFTPVSKTVECELCKDTGWIDFVDDNGYDVTSKCKCRIKKESIEYAEKSGIGVNFRDRTFANLDLSVGNMRNVAKQVWKWKNDARSRGILLCGTIGSGKTHLGVATLNEWLTAGKSVHFWNYQDLMRELGRHSLDDRFDELMRDLKRKDRIMIDDLFKSNIRETHVSYMYEIVNARYEAQQKTIFTSEKTLGELIEIDEGIGSRIAEMCEGYVINMEGFENYRTKRGAS